jgi:D-alanyl-D-alanine carboxypeptidase
LKRAVVFLLLIIIASQPFPLTVYADASVIDSGYLWLINPDNRIPKDYAAPDMVEHNGHRMRPVVRDAYERMSAAMRADGIHGFYIHNAFRDYNQQSFIFSRKVASYQTQGYDSQSAINMTARSIAYPGASEHQSGLAIDVTVNGKLNQAFADTEAGRWLAENSHEYGFIIRYPRDKTHITGIIFEPWHLRYVGSPHASYMKEKNLCLEEYIEYLQINKMYVYWGANRAYYLVSYGESPDESITRVVEDISADRAGDNGTLVYTTRRTMLLLGGN